MTAKSAPQLLHVPAVQIAPHTGRTLLALLFAVILAVAAWVIEEQKIERLGAPGSPMLEASGTSDEAEPAVTAASATPASIRSDEGRHRALSEFLAKRYKVSRTITFDLVEMAHTAGRQIGLDPLLIIAVMAVESRFNPIAESVAGAKGLMQVIPRYHLEKFREFGGERYAVFDPETNILVGTRILKDYLMKTGNIDSALQLYVGSSREDDEVYIDKVMDEKQRLQQVLKKSRTRAPDLET